MRRVLIFSIDDIRTGFHRNVIPVTYERCPALLYRYSIDQLFMIWLSYQLTDLFNIPVSNDLWRLVSLARHTPELDYLRVCNYNISLDLWSVVRPPLCQFPIAGLTLERLDVNYTDLFLYFEG